MLFSSLIFLWIFLPIILFLTKILPIKFANIILLLSSLFFYAWGEPKYIILMLISITLNYISGILIDKFNSKKIILSLSVISNLSLLGYFKYFDFFANIFNTTIGSELIPIKNIILPIGISFYTFQAMSYVVDVYRNETKVQKNWFLLALYISFFPQLIAGPIVQYSSIENQLLSRDNTFAKTSYGIKRFVYGLSKKVVLANSFALIADRILGIPVNELSTTLSWFAVILYTFQIYYDFSGYSDMAIGLGNMFGFDFPENFNYPYISRSLTEFWRRWHISLSSWFRNYLYIPLGGNKKGVLRTLVNLMIVFFCTGLWHGASVQFIVWGIYNGAFLIVERLFLKKHLNQYKILSHIYTALVVLVGWTIFRAPGMMSAIILFKNMFIFTKGNPAYTLSAYADLRVIFLLLIGILLCGILQHILPKWQAKLYDKNNITVLDIIIIMLLFFTCIMSLVSNTYNPFIYFRF